MPRLGPHAAATLALAALAAASLLAGTASAVGEKDWIDSPITVGNKSPPGNVTVFVSAYLDRLISVDEEDYTFHAKFYFIMSWLDARAPAALKAGTDEMIANNGTCVKPCSGQRILEGDPTAGTCCTNVWAPAALFRNVKEFPQGRTQPYVFFVSPDGRVSYRVEVNGEFVSPLQLRSYPLDVQDLAVVIVYTNFNPTVSNVSFAPSASGSKIFTFGSGDDLSGYRVEDVFVRTRAGLWSDQFSRANLAPSARGDPLPVFPAPRTADALSAAAVAGGTNASAVLTPAKMFGRDYTISEVQIVIRLQRLVAASGLQILPIVLCTSVAFITLFVSAQNIDTRMQIVVTLFLTLVAIQFVLEQDLPKASYVIPARQAVFLSYGVLCACAVETIFVHSVCNWPSVRGFIHGAREARRRQAEIARAAAAAARWRRLDRGGSGRVERSMRNGGILGRLGSGGSTGGGGVLEGTVWGRVLDGVRARRHSGSGGGGTFRAPAAAAVAAADGRGPGGDVEAAVGGSPAAAGAATTAKATPVVAFAVDGPTADGAAGAAAAPGAPPRPTSPPLLGRSDSTRSDRGGDAMDDSAEAARVRALEADLEAWWWRHVAWCVDMAAFVLLGGLYMISLLIIFAAPYFAARRAKVRGLPDGSAWQAAHDNTAPGGLLMPAPA